MYGNLQEKYKNLVFQSLEIYKAFSNFDYNLAIRKIYTGFCNSFEMRLWEGFRYLAKLSMQINSSTY